MTDEEWLLQLWDQMTEQTFITLKFCRTSQKDSTLSVYHLFHGKWYNWNVHPMALPGTRVVMYKDHTMRRSWVPLGLDAWHCGPAFDHYRNMIFFVPKTGDPRVSGSFDLFPQHCLLPTLNPTQHVEVVHEELRESIMALPKKKTTTVPSKCHH